MIETADIDCSYPSIAVNSRTRGVLRIGGPPSILLSHPMGNTTEIYFLNILHGSEESYFSIIFQNVWILEQTSEFFFSFWTILKRKPKTQPLVSHAWSSGVWNSFVRSVGSLFIFYFHLRSCLDNDFEYYPTNYTNNELYFSISLYVVCATLYKRCTGFLILLLTLTTTTDEVLESIHVLRLQSFWL